MKLDIRAQAKGLYHAVFSNGKKNYMGKIVFEFGKSEKYPRFFFERILIGSIFTQF